MPGEQLFVNRPLPGAQLDTSHPLAKGLVGCWLLNEQGSRAYDLSSYKNHGILNGFTSPLYSLGQRDNYRVEFNSSSTYIDCGNTTSLNINSSLSLLGWFKTNDLTILQGLWGKGTLQGSNLGLGYCVSYDTGKRISFDRYDGSLRQTLYSATNSILSINKYYCIVCTWDGTTTTNSVRIYINGLLSNQTTSTINNIINSSTSFKIGRNPVSALQFLNGSVNNVFIWNRALSNQDIKNLYISPYSPGGKNMFI
jgi:hypothetical protein